MEERSLRPNRAAAHDGRDVKTVPRFASSDLLLYFCPHPEWAAAYNLVHQAHEPVILARNVTTDLIHYGPIRLFEATAQRISHEFFRKVMREERGIRFQKFLQPFCTADRGAVGQRA